MVNRCLSLLSCTIILLYYLVPDMLRSIGADQVIDYTQEDFTKSGETYDVIFDVVGKISFSSSDRSLKQNGTYLL
ncbi:MAG: zinc-binding dehydrogenase, partial [Atribacterota bacterium]